MTKDQFSVLYFSLSSEIELIPRSLFFISLDFAASMKMAQPLLTTFSMANLPRYALLDDGSTFHITWQCHNHDWLLAEDWAKQYYYNLLLQYKDRYRVQFYSYCFMSNHPHLTGLCQSKEKLSDLFRLVNSLFAKFYNRRVGRKGQVVMDRFKSPRIQTNADLLKVMFYIDLNPKRAGMIRHPREYRWSSFNHYAYGKRDPLITTAPSYLQLAPSSLERQKLYREMILEILKNDWKEKKPYSSIPFIGDPDWVLLKTTRLKIFQRLIRLRQKLKSRSWEG